MGKVKDEREEESVNMEWEGKEKNTDGGEGGGLKMEGKGERIKKRGE